MSNPASAWPRIIGTVIVLVVAFVLLQFYLLLSWRVPDVKRSYATSGDSRIVFVDLDGSEAELPLYSSTGEPLDTAFAIRGSLVFYWSWPDKSIAAMDIKSGKVKWYGIGEDLGVGRITCDSRFVSIESYGFADERSAILLDTKTEDWKTLKSVVQARLDPSDTGQIVMLQQDGQFVTADAENPQDRRFLCTFNDVRDWDYDFETKRLFVLGNGIREGFTIWSGKGSVKHVPSPANSAVFSVLWQSKVHELWVFAHGPTSATPGTLVFSSDGNFLGVLRWVGYHSIVALDSQDTRAFAKALRAVPRK